MNAVNRRNFLFGSAAVSAATFCLPSFVYAQDAGAPVRGGILTVNFRTDPPNFDPISNTTSRTLYSVAPCYNSLVMFDPMEPSKVVGDLAESWETSEDGRTITFKLIQNAKFHDGVGVTAHDVKFSFDRVRQPPEGEVSARQDQLSAIEEITVVDDYTVAFNLKYPSPSLLINLSSGWMLVLPKHFVEAGGDLKTSVMGSGPFKFKGYQAGVSVELERNPNYHKPDRPYLDGITFYIIPEPATQLGYLRTGQLLLMESMASRDAERAKAEFGDRVLVQEVPSYGFAHIIINTTRAPWSDIRARQALAFALNKQEGLEVLREGAGYVGGAMPAGGPWALPADQLSGLPGYGGDRTANLAEAKRLLAEAGVPEGQAVTLTTKKGEEYESMSIWAADQLAQIGLKATLDIQEDATAYETLTKGDFEIVAWDGTVTADDPDAVFGQFYTTSASRNYAGISNAELDELFSQQTKEQDVEARKAIVNKMELVALNEVGIIVLYWRRSTLGQSLRVHDLVMHSAMDNNHKFEGVWLSP